MQRFFTQSLQCLVLSILAFSVSAQTINTLTVNSPAGIAGNYNIIRAAFGSASNAPITANAGFVNDGSATVTDGCQDPTNNLTGLVAFIDRGTCEFSDKALRAQNKGAIAVIICQNQGNAAQAIFSMATGTFGAQVTVPTFMCSYNDCQKIRTDIIAGGANVSLQNTCATTAVYPANTVWGNVEGQGDFKGGLNDWTVDKDSTWAFSPEGASAVEGWPQPSYGGTTILGWSGCNGAMVFNSDALDSDGTSSQGVGPCPAVCSGALISPVIDLSSKNVDGIVIEFGQATRQFQSGYFLMASKDGGATWPDTIVLNASLPVNSNVIQSRERVALVGYEGVQNLRFKFEYDGNYYYWMIDDVIVLNEAKADIQVNDNFYATAPTLIVPASQVAPMGVLTDVSNIGNKNAQNTVLEFIVTDRDNGNAEVYRDSKNYGNVTAGTSIENQVFASTFTPPAVPGTYDAQYIIKSDGDSETTGNNVRSIFFYVSESTYGTVNPEALSTPANYLPYALSPWADGTTARYYSMANPFYVVNGKNQTVEKLTFGFANANFGDINETGNVDAEIFEWIDADGDNQCQFGERTKIGAGTMLVSEENMPNPRFVDMPVWAFENGEYKEGTPIALKDNTNYVAVLHAAPFDPSIQYQFLGYSGRTTSGFDRSVNYSAQRLALDSIPALAERTAGSLFQMTGTDSDAAERTFEVIQNGTLETAAFLEITVVPANSTFDINDKIEVSTFPNPASRELYVDLALINSSDVRLELITVDGKVAASQNYSSVQDSRLKLDLSNVISGSYSLLVHTNDGVTAKRVIVAK